MKPYKLNIKDLDLQIPKNKQREAMKAAAEFLKVEVLDYIGEGKSPVSGFGKFPEYTKSYSAEKGSSLVNLELTGELLDALDVKVKGSSLELNVYGSDEVQGKAEGNNLGTYGNPKPIKGKARRFIPVGDETLKRDIIARLKELLSDYEE